MPELNEKLLQFVWQHRLLKAKTFKTVSGKTLTVLRTGELNRDAGPDFFNGHIRLGDVELAGNIELHLRTSDWVRHGHQHDRSYDNIILHVVYEHDITLDQNSLNNVEVLAVKDLLPDQTIARYTGLMNSRQQLPCAGLLKMVGSLRMTGWIERMTFERLEQKLNTTEALFRSFNSDYTQTFYAMLLRNFGFKVNSLPFELLAKNLPVHLLLKNADNLLQLEAMLFGTAGLLDGQLTDKYLQNLQNEFLHLKNKYHLVPLQKEIFKRSRLRPANFPTLRLAQFAALVHLRPDLLTAPQNFTNVAGMKKILQVEPVGYWKDHYTLRGDSSARSTKLGPESAENLLINSFAPFFFFYGRRLAKNEFTGLAVELLENTGFEKNAKTRLFDTRKDILKSAADSQGLIHLYDNYCSRQQCLRCGIGVAILGQA